MAQSLGADLWHMWHFHGSYGFLHPDKEEFPYGIRVKRFPDWIPGQEQRAVVQAPWIILDKYGERYMNEFPPYVQDTGWRDMEHFDPVTQSFPRIPSLLIYDELGRRRFPMGNPAYNERDMTYVWSKDNSKEIEEGIIKKADTVGELAEMYGIDGDKAEEIHGALERDVRDQRRYRIWPPGRHHDENPAPAILWRSGLAGALQHAGWPGA